MFQPPNVKFVRAKVPVFADAVNALPPATIASVGMVPLVALFALYVTMFPMPTVSARAPLQLAPDVVAPFLSNAM